MTNKLKVTDDNIDEVNDALKEYHLNELKMTAKALKNKFYNDECPSSEYMKELKELAYLAYANKCEPEFNKYLKESILC